MQQRRATLLLIVIAISIVHAEGQEALNQFSGTVRLGYVD
jgi:hypothetical protein